MSPSELSPRPDLRTRATSFNDCRKLAFLSANASDIPPDIQQGPMNQGPWMLDSRSLGIGIAIGVLITIILGAFVGLLSVSLRRKPYKRKSSRRTTSRSRPTLPLSFSMPQKLTNSRTKHIPTAAERISLDSRMGHGVAPPRSPSPEIVLDIAPRKAREASPSSPSTQLEPQSLSELDLEEMRAANTFSGLPTAANADTSRPPSTQMNDFVFDTRPPVQTDPSSSSSSGTRQSQTSKHKRLSELEVQEGLKASWAHPAVRRVQSAGYLDQGAHPSGRPIQYPSQDQLYARKLEQEAEWSRTRGMGHTLPRPQTAKTVTSRPGTGGTANTGTGLTGLGTANLDRDTPFSSSSSLGLPLSSTTGTGTANVTVDGFSPASASGSGRSQLYLLSQQEKEIRKQRRRRHEKDNVPVSPLMNGPPGVSRPSPALRTDSQTTLQHTLPRGLPITIPVPLEQEADIAPPPYNVANVHSSHTDHQEQDRPSNDFGRDRRWQHHLHLTGDGLDGLDGLEDEENRRGPDQCARDRSNSDSRSTEMGFGQSHHARNHLL